jgi:ParB family chromosome partitioning protein
VRATERAVRKRAEPSAAPEDEELARHKIIVGELEMRLRRRLGAQVRLNTGGKKDRGVVEIPYASLDELDRLLRVILGDPGAVR